MTQQDLADRAGVGIRFIRELEGGKPTLRLDKVNLSSTYSDIPWFLLPIKNRENKVCQQNRSLLLLLSCQNHV